MELPKVGMRAVKTAVAVFACFLVFLPFWSYVPSGPEDLLRQVAPINACIAAIICMQSSVEESVSQGLYRVIGTVLGGAVGLVCLLLSNLIGNRLMTGVLLGLGTVITLWICKLIKRPEACAMGCVVLCAIMLTNDGANGYLYIPFRILENLVGVLVAVAVNHVLPNHHREERKQDGAEPPA